MANTAPWPDQGRNCITRNKARRLRKIKAPRRRGAECSRGSGFVVAGFDYRPRPQFVALAANGCNDGFFLAGSLQLAPEIRDMHIEAAVNRIPLALEDFAIRGLARQDARSTTKRQEQAGFPCCQMGHAPGTGQLCGGGVETGLPEANAANRATGTRLGLRSPKYRAQLGEEWKQQRGRKFTDVATMFLGFVLSVILMGAGISWAVSSFL